MAPTQKRKVLPPQVPGRPEIQFREKNEEMLNTLINKEDERVRRITPEQSRRPSGFLLHEGIVFLYNFAGGNLMEEKRERLHFVSLGTSILSNLKNLRKEEFEDMPGPGPALEDWLKERRNDKEFYEKAYKALAEEPYRFSAELNGMRDFLDKGEVDQVYLIATDTEAGRFCYKLLFRFFREREIEVMSAGPLLGYYKADKALGKKLGPEAASGIFADDLHLLFNNLMELLRKHKQEQGKDVLINATGGFKPEMAILSLAGNLFLVPVYYVHETFKKVVFLPPLIPPALFPEELEVLEQIYSKPDRRIVGKEWEVLYTEKKAVVDSLADFRVLEILFHHETDIEYGAELTPQGIFWVEIQKKTEELE